MTTTTTAIYENGAFKPLKPIKGIPERSIVQINVETIKKYTKKRRLAMLAAIPVDEELADAIEVGNCSRSIVSRKLRDVMIAATALDLGLPIATLNRSHFEKIPE